MASRTPFRSYFLLVVLLLVAACDKQPGEETLRTEVSGLLEREFAPELFDITSLRRMGSAPSRDKATGDQRQTVYFNAQLRFRKDFDLTAWDHLSATSLAFLLGATERGITGIRQGGNRAGDVLRVHGSRMYALRQGTWRPLLVAADRNPGFGQSAETSNIIAKISALAEQAVRRYGGAEGALIDRELQASLERIQRQLDQLAEVLSVASGPAGGAYHRYIQLLEDNVGRTGFGVRNLTTQGSVQNCQLVQSGSVDLAIAQSNIAALAIAGEGPFRQQGRLKDIRALSALFPEYLQVVVTQGSNINSLAALKGRRIDIGVPDSGTRVDALRLLATIGLKLPDFAEVRESGLEDAVQAMRAGELDAFFTTLQAPTPALQNLFASNAVRLVPITPETRTAMLDTHGVYRHATIAAHTYPGQHTPVPTLSVTATLIVRADLPDARVAKILDQLFDSATTLARENLRLTLLSRQRAQEGVLIPMHTAVGDYFANRRESAVTKGSK